MIVCLYSIRDSYYCGILSHGSGCNSSMRSNMSNSSYVTIIMDNSHDLKNDDGQASAVLPNINSSVHV